MVQNPLLFKMPSKPLNHFPNSVGTEGFEELLEVCHGGIVGEACVAEDGVERALLGDGLQCHGIDILVKTGDKLAAVDVEARLAADFALDDLRGVLDAKRR